MTIEEIRAKLYHHANLPSDSEPGNSLCFLLSRQKREAKPVDMASLAASFREVFGCLEELNRAWNGPTPSKTTGDRILNHLERRIVYSANAIISDAVAYALQCVGKPNLPTTEIRVAVQVAYALSCAWDEVLAGDIDDLQEAVMLQSEAYLPGASQFLWEEFWSSGIP